MTAQARLRARSTHHPQRRRKLKLCLAGCSLLLSLVVLEFGLRLAGIEFPSRTRWDRNRGFANVPNSVWKHDAEGESLVRINRFGFRDENWPVEADDDTVRVAVLGDSFVAAHEVDEAERFTELLEKELDAATKSAEVDVMNFGVRGYGTAQELMTYRHVVRDFAPDVVLLAVFTGNDIVNNCRALQRAAKRPYFNIRDGRLVLDETFRNSVKVRGRHVLQAAAAHSRTVQLVHRVGCLLTRKRAHHSGQLHQRLFDAGLKKSCWVEHELYLDPVNSAWRQAWTVTERLIAKLRDEVEQDGAELRVVVLSNPCQVHPDETFRDALCNAAGIDDLFYPDRRIRRLCHHEDIDVLVLAPEMQRHADRSNVWYHGFENCEVGIGHWNESGHAIAADLISNWLLDDARISPEPGEVRHASATDSELN
ncbi:hypothetical protein GC176_00200 [bacterium]|nr:hypothetical protein [bacterium]